MNNSFNEKIDRINVAKENIKTSLINKGLSPSDNIEDYASLIESIEQGSGSGDIKVYSNIKTMNNDKTQPFNTKGLVYGSTIREGQKDDIARFFIFPETVVLDKAITEYATDGYLYAFFEPVESKYSSSASLRIDWGMNGEDMIEIRWESNDFGYWYTLYTSEDLITWTRSTEQYYCSEGDTQIDIRLGDSYEPWNEIFGKFINVKIYELGGLFEYKSVTNIKKYFVDPETNICYTLPNKFFTDLNMDPDTSSFYGDALIIMKEADSNYEMTNFIIARCAGGNMVRRLKSGNIDCIAVDDWGDIGIYEFKNNQATSYNKTTWPNIQSLGANSGYSTGTMWKVCDMNNSYKLFGFDTSESSTWYVLTLSGGEAEKTNEIMDCNNHTISKWIACPNQLTLNNSNELLPGKVALGKEGQIIGDETVYDNLDNALILKNFYNFTDKKKDNYCGFEEGNDWILGTNLTDYPSAKIKYIKETNNIDDYRGLKISANEFVSIDNFGDILKELGREDVLASATCTRSLDGRYVIFIHSNNEFQDFILDTQTNTIVHEFNGYSIIPYKNKFYYKESNNSNVLRVIDLNTLEDKIALNFPVSSFEASSPGNSYSIQNRGKYILLYTKACVEDKHIGLSYIVYNMETEKASTTYRLEGLNCTGWARAYIDFIWTQNSIICSTQQNKSGTNNLTFSMARFDFSTETWTKILDVSSNGIGGSGRIYHGWEQDGYVYYNYDNTSNYRFKMNTTWNRETLTYSGTLRPSSINWTKDYVPMVYQNGIWYEMKNLNISGTNASINYDTTKPLYIAGSKACLFSNFSNGLDISRCHFKLINGYWEVYQYNYYCSGKALLIPITVSNINDYSCVVININAGNKVRLAVLQNKSYNDYTNTITPEEYDDINATAEYVLGGAE